ncbi:hypothetical protein E2C01_055667 [Portunus trituberculatus]|uniref:Uncharacterized protein n=1 Tax=Portunus trituberculatus TaxID=210409 RepID=A0A5B7GVE3_PORTR|nr:hypothetical protein [Portunus trituberculatus]
MVDHCPARLASPRPSSRVKVPPPRVGAQSPCCTVLRSTRSIPSP